MSNEKILALFWFHTLQLGETYVNATIKVMLTVTMDTDVEKKTTANKKQFPDFTKLVHWLWRGKPGDKLQQTSYIASNVLSEYNYQVKEI